MRKMRRGFYAATFPDSKVTAIHQSPRDFPSGKEGEILTVEFTVFGVPCWGSMWASVQTQRAFSFQIATVPGGNGSLLECDCPAMAARRALAVWCRDRWGISWQIPAGASLTDRDGTGGAEAKRASMR